MSSEMTRQKLVQAYQLIKSGQKDQAVELLTPLLKTDRDNADGWWLMANALSNPAHQRQALQNVLRLRPNDEKARALLNSLGASSAPTQQTPLPSSSAPTRQTPIPSTPPPREEPPTMVNRSPRIEDDPFAAPSSPRSAPADDPFAHLDDDPFALPKESRSAADDPFAARSSRSSTADDPFARRSPKRSASEDDPFAATNSGDDPFASLGEDDDPFAELDDKPAKRGASSKSIARPAPKKSSGGGTNPVVIVLAVVGVIVLIGCIACFALSIGGTALLGPAIQQAMTEGAPAVVEGLATQLAPYVTVEPGGGVTFGGSTTGGSLSDISMTIQGAINIDQPVSGTVSDAFDDHGYTFQGDAGTRVIIDAGATDGQLDTQLALYDASGAKIAENDDITFMDNTDSRIDLVLPSTGQYTIVVSGFASGGAYELRVSRG